MSKSVCSEILFLYMCAWIKPTGRATGGASTHHKIVSHATLKRFYNDTSDTPLEEVVNDFSE